MCNGWPGWPPRRRGAASSGSVGLGGLTRSEEGGLEEVEESLRAWASCSWSCARWWRRESTSVWRVCSWFSRRWQLPQGWLALLSMRGNSTTQPPRRHYHRESLRGFFPPELYEREVGQPFPYERNSKG